MLIQVSKYERIVQEQDDYRKQIMLDLETVREINNKIEGQREAHARQAANRYLFISKFKSVHWFNVLVIKFIIYVENPCIPLFVLKFN